MSVTVDDVRAARARVAGQVLETPLTHSRILSERVGAELYIKFENLQFTASFKERGALNKLCTLSAAERRRGVVAMSAGNHAQALAYHGRRLGVPTCIVMPRTTPNAKVEQTRVFGAEVLLHGSQFDETLAFTEALARERGMTLVHPYDDPAVVAGQGTLGLEILDQLPGLGALAVPVGGGGLIAGVATAVKALRPGVRIVGVQAARYPAVSDAFHGVATRPVEAATVAEGIAVRTPGRITLPIIERLVDDVVTVPESAIEDAIFILLELEKTVAEGAGAAALAAVLGHSDAFRGAGPVAAVLSGGNIDMMVLSSVLQRGLVHRRRLVKLSVELPDVPGSLAKLTALLGALDSNIVDIVHQRAFGGSSVRATLVELILQMRGEEQADAVLAELDAAGYRVALHD